MGGSSFFFWLQSFVESIPFMNIVIGLIVFVSVMQTCNDANFEIKYRTLILEAESVQLPVSIVQSIHDDMLLACYDFFSFQNWYV